MKRMLRLFSAAFFFKNLRQIKEGVFLKKKKPAILRLIDWLSEASGYLSALAILLATIIIVYQVIIRYILGSSTVWQTQMAIYLILFTTFVGAAYGLKHDAHVGIDLIYQKLPTRGRALLKIITSFFSLLLTIITAWKAWEMWYQATTLGWKASTVWAVPLTYPYFILPLGMTLVSLQFIVIIYEQFNILINSKNINVDNTDSTKPM